MRHRTISVLGKSVTGLEQAFSTSTLLLPGAGCRNRKTYTCPRLSLCASTWPFDENTSRIAEFVFQASAYHTGGITQYLPCKPPMLLNLQWDHISINPSQPENIVRSKMRWILATHRASHFSPVSLKHAPNAYASLQPGRIMSHESQFATKSSVSPVLHYLYCF